MLVCPNHQSYLDPVVVGIGFRRHLNYLARKSLFRFAPFRWLISSLHAIPLEREGLGMAGLKESLRRLKRGEPLLVFPEGTRSTDGQVSPLKPGFLVLARRTRATLVPVGVDGAFEAWPRTSRWPRPGRIYIEIGRPIDPEMASQLDDANLLREIERRIRDCQSLARQRQTCVRRQHRATLDAIGQGALK
jgi:1-acyl-sn-glycerol-3-phosphate acyltransferase